MFQEEARMRHLYDLIERLQEIVQALSDLFNLALLAIISLVGEHWLDAFKIFAALAALAIFSMGWKAIVDYFTFTGDKPLEFDDD